MGNREKSIAVDDEALAKVTGGEYDFVIITGNITLVTSDDVWITSTPSYVYGNDDNQEYTLSYISNSDDGRTSTYLFRQNKDYRKVLAITVTGGNNKTELVRYVRD